MTARDRFFERLRGVLGPPTATAVLPEDLRAAGVLVPLRSRGGEITVVLARRSERVPHHKGQVCFPGGSRDPGDPDLFATALREAEEELGIRREDVVLLGTMEPVLTVTGFAIQPFVARIPDEAVFALDPFEMAEVFEAPLRAFAAFDRYRHAESVVRGKESRVYFFDYGPHTIWGATAKVLRRLAELAAPLAGEIDTSRPPRLK